MANLNIAVAILGQDKASGPINVVVNSLNRLENAAHAGGNQLGVMGVALGTAAGNLVSGGIGLITNAVRGLVEQGSSGVAMARELQAALDDTGSAAGLSAAEITKLKDLTMQLGVDPKLKVEADQAAAAIDSLIRGGVTLSDVMNGAARNTVLLSNATGGDFALSATISSDVMKLWNIRAEDMAQAVNGITAMTIASKFSINDYQLALAQAGGVAASVGVEFDDFNASIAAISPLFASGSDAGTSFKTFLQRLIPASDPAADAMMKLGLITEDGANAFFTATGQLKSMAEITGILHDATKGLSEEQKNQAFSTIFGTDAMRAAFGIAGMTEQQFLDLQETMGKTDAAQAAADRMDNLSGSMEIMGGMFDTLKIKIADKFLPVLKQGVDGAIVAFDRSSGAIEGVFDTIVESVGRGTQFVSDAFASFEQGYNLKWVDSDVVQPLHRFAGIAGTVMGLADEVATAFERIQNGQGAQSYIGMIVREFAEMADLDLDTSAFQTAVDTVTSSLGGLNALATGQSIGPFVADIVRGIDSLAGLDVDPATLTSTIDGITTTLEGMRTKWNEAGQIVPENSEAIKGGIIGIGVALAAAGIGASIAAISAGLLALVNPVTALIVIGGILGAAWGGNWGNIQGVVTGAITAISGAIEQARPTLEMIGKVLTDTLGPTFTKMVEDLSAKGITFEQTWTAVVGAVSSIAQAFVMAIGVVGAVVLAIFTGLFNGVMSAANIFIGSLMSVIQSVAQIFNGLGMVLQGVWGFIVGLFTLNGDLIMESLGKVALGILNILGGAFTGVLAVIVGVIGTVLSFVGGFVSGVIEFFKHLYDVLVGHSIVPDMVMEILKWFLSLKDKALDLVRELWTEVVAEFDGAKNRMFTLGKQIVTRLADGIRAAPGAVLSALQWIVDQAIASILARLGIQQGASTASTGSGKEVNGSVGTKGMVSGESVSGLMGVPANGGQIKGDLQPGSKGAVVIYQTNTLTIEKIDSRIEIESMFREFETRIVRANGGI